MSLIHTCELEGVNAFDYLVELQRHAAALGVWLGAGLWAMYRIVRGWLALRDRRPVY